MASAAQRRRDEIALRSVDLAPWSVLRRQFLRVHEQGEHIAVIGPTGQGKTTLAYDLLSGVADVRGGFVSRASAEEHYGAVLAGDGLSMDLAATAARRARRPQAKLFPRHGYHAALA